MLDLVKMRALVSRDHVALIEAAYGPPGMAAFDELAPVLDRVHEELAYEILDHLTIFRLIGGSPQYLQGGIEVTVSQLPGLVQGVATIEVLDNGNLYLVPEPLDPVGLSEDAVVYHFSGERDYFVADGELTAVENPSGFPSLWGIPTFFLLEEALEHYRDEIVLACRCQHLKDLWHDQAKGRRWLLINSPEDLMQECLENFLVFSLRDHKRIEIRREQPIAGKPPDIKVTWSLTNRIAYIEVKWMGSSVHTTESRISWSPGETEANEGAQQLADYLDANQSEAIDFQTKGYLVVFDGRRRGLAFDTDDLSYEDAWHFRTLDIEYDPDYSQLRADFAKPLRCFMPPLRPTS